MSDTLITPDPAKHPRAKPYHESIRAALAQYRDEHNLSLAELARECDSNPTAVHKYLAGKPEGDLEALESNVADVLKTAPGRRRVAAKLFSTDVTRAINSACETIRKTNDVGLITGPAGIGKTAGKDLYLISNPNTLAITLTRWHRDAGSIECLLEAEFDSQRRVRNDDGKLVKRRTRRIDFLLEKLKGSNRLIVVDNFHRITRGGLQWFFDFADATGCPMAGIANPEVLDAIKANDQQFSRIGLHRELTLNKSEVAAVNMLERYCPKEARKLESLAIQVAGERGHLRALKKHLLLMPEFIGAAKGDVRAAFRMAHTQLVNDYQLTDDDEGRAA